MNDLEHRLREALCDPMRDPEAPSTTEAMAGVRAMVHRDSGQAASSRRLSWLPVLATVTGIAAVVLGVVVVVPQIGERAGPGPGEGSLTGLEATSEQAFADMLERGTDNRLGPWHSRGTGTSALDEPSVSLDEDPSASALTCLLSARDSSTAEPRSSVIHQLVTDVAGEANGAAATSLDGEYADSEDSDAEMQGLRSAYSRCSGAAPLEPMTSASGDANGFATQLRFHQLPGYTQHTLVLRWQNRVIILALNAPNQVVLDSQRLFDALAEYTSQPQG